MIIGVDKGTTFTKTSEKLIFQSTLRKYKENEINLYNDKIVVEYEDNKYVVGEKGNYSTDLMKSKHFNTKLLTLVAIGLSSNKEVVEVDLITGLPIALYSTQKEKMKEIFNSYELHTLKINGEKKYIKIKDIEVFPEAAGAFYSQNEYLSGLVIDIGGLSIDTALFIKQRLEKYSTYSMGIMKLYSRIANKLNSEYDLSFTELDIPDVLKEGLYIYGKRVELGIENLIIEHVQEIISRLKLEYDVKTINHIMLTGGGSILLFDYLKQELPQSTLIENPQFSNAIGYKNIGQVIF